jgi:hypothetical protein
VLCIKKAFPGRKRQRLRICGKERESEKEYGEHREGEFNIRDIVHLAALDWRDRSRRAALVSSIRGFVLTNLSTFCGTIELS